MEDFLSHGTWDDIEGKSAKPAQEEMAQRRLDAYHHAVRVRNCFKTKDGKYTLEWLAALFEKVVRFDPTPQLHANPMQPMAPAQLQDGMSMAFQGFYREGGAAFFRTIERQIAIAEAGPPTAADTEEGAE